MHACDIYIANIVTFSIYFSAPNVSVGIADGGTIPADRDGYQLICSVYGAENLDPVFAYQWIKNSTSPPQEVGTTNTLSFTSLQLSDAAQYVCSVTISSRYLSGDIVALSSQDVRIQSKLSLIFTTSLGACH